MSQRKGSKESKESSEARVPPHSLLAEESVLGGILIDNHVMNVALEMIRAEDFYKGSHAAIFSAMQTLSEKREPIDVVTLSAQLRSMGALEDVGGVEYLGHLAAVVPSSANVAYYAKVVKEKSLKRRVIHEAGTIIRDALEDEGDVSDFLDEVEQKILSVADYRVNSSFHRVGDVVQDSIKVIEKLYDKKEAVTGIPSGFIRLDDITAGFQRSDLVIIAARPSMGKTAFALNICEHVGITKGLNVAVFSLEMSKEQLVLRMLASEAEVNASKIRTGRLVERDFPKLVDAAGRIAESPIFIDDTPGLTVTEVRAKSRRLHKENPLSLIVIDYLQLMRSPAYSHSREQEISDISQSLKALAKELSVPVIALSQLNRAPEARNDKRPLMSDLRESGAIEQDADVIMFIYRDEMYNPDTSEKGLAEILVSKHRTGPTGLVKLVFAPEFTKFRNYIERDDLAEYASGATDEGDDFGIEAF